MKKVNPEECDALASKLLDLAKDHEAHIGIGAHIMALRAYGDALPGMRSAIGRALLLMGGEFVSSAPLYIPQAENLPPTSTTLQ